MIALALALVLAGCGGGPVIAPGGAPAAAGVAEPEETSAEPVEGVTQAEFAAPASAHADVEHVHYFDDGSSAVVPPRAVPAAPQVHPRAQVMDDVGTVAALAHFYEARHYAFVTGDTAPLEAVSADGCSSCAEVVTTAPSLVAQGYDVRGGAAALYDAVVGADASMPGDPTARVVEVTLVAEPQFVLQGDRMVMAEPAQAFAVRASLRHDGERWRVAGIHSERVG